MRLSPNHATAHILLVAAYLGMAGLLAYSGEHAHAGCALAAALAYLLLCRPPSEPPGAPAWGRPTFTRPKHSPTLARHARRPP